MKKLISWAVVTTIATSLVPCSVYAAEEISQIKTVGEIEWNVEEAKAKPNVDNVELQIKLKDFSHSFNNKNEIFEFELDFDGAHITTENNNPFDLTAGKSGVYRKGVKLDSKIYLAPHEIEDSKLTFEVHENGVDFVENDEIVIVAADIAMDRYSEGAKATVSVSGDFGEATNLSVAEVCGNAINIDYTKKLPEVGIENEETLKTITIESKVGKFSTEDKIKVEINNKFNFVDYGTITNGSIDISSSDEYEFTIVPTTNTDKIVIKGMVIEALDTAKPNDIAKIEVRCKNYDSDSMELAKVVGEEVRVTIDEDEDIPVMYSGTDVDNTGLNSSESHKSLEVTIEEVTEGSWNPKNSWTISLTDGVYVSDIEDADLKSENMTFINYPSGPMNMFKKAYEKGDYESFEFNKRSFEVDDDSKAKMEFSLILVAEPNFEGDVELTFDNGDFKETVTIAKFVKPYEVTTKQNNVSVDYRYSNINSEICVKEAEEGLWNTGTEFKFFVDHMDFEDTEKYSANFDVKEINSLKNNELGFKITEESDEEAFEVKIENMSLYMNRNLPAGGYDLIMNSTMSEAYMNSTIFGSTEDLAEVIYDRDSFDEVIKENFVNIVIGEDNLYITKVIVPVGEKYIITGEEVITLDVPAYINADGYTMLPVRAVAQAFGISNEAIVWNNTAKTVTIFYGGRIITMTMGSEVMTVNGSTIPTASTIEVVDGRMFIPMRDLATALGAKSLTWDPVTKTACFN